MRSYFKALINCFEPFYCSNILKGYLFHRMFEQSICSGFFFLYFLNIESGWVYFRCVFSQNTFSTMYYSDNSDKANRKLFFHHTKFNWFVDSNCVGMRPKTGAQEYLIEYIRIHVSSLSWIGTCLKTTRHTKNNKWIDINSSQTKRCEWHLMLSI